MINFKVVDEGRPLKIDFKNTVFTIGHSSQQGMPMEKFLKILKENHIGLLVDLRTRPFSQFNPRFSQKNLVNELNQNKVQYLWMGQDLGGYPVDQKGHKYESFVKYMRSAKTRFGKAIDLLLKTQKNLKENEGIVIMCSEKDHHNCHRQHIAEFLNKKHGQKIIHLPVLPNQKVIPEQGELF